MRSYCARGKSKKHTGRVHTKVTGAKRKYSETNVGSLTTRLGTVNKPAGNRPRKKAKNAASGTSNDGSNDISERKENEQVNVVESAANSLQSINISVVNQSDNATTDESAEDIDMESRQPQIRHIDTMIESKVNDDDVDVMASVMGQLQELNLDYAPSEEFKEFHRQILLYPHYGIRARNKENTVFIIPDYDYKTDMIKYANFRHVFKMDAWVCNCDQFVYKNNRKYCDHTILAILFTNSNPTNLPFFPYDTSDEKVVSETEEGSVKFLMAPKCSRKMAIYSVENNDNRYAFVHINNLFKNIVCELHKGRSSCRHRALLLQLLPEEAREAYKLQSQQPAQDTVYWDDEEGFGHHSFLIKEAPKCVSFKRIPVPAVWHTEHDETPEQETYYAATKLRNVPLKLTPKIEVCECGETLSEANDHLKQTKAILFDTSTNYHVDVYNRRCTHCDKNYVYDGLGDKIFNYNDDILVFHDVFQQFLFLRHMSKCPMNTFITTQLSLYSGNNSITPFFNGVTFSKLLGIFVQLQNYDNKLRCRACEKEQKMPQIIGCDATSLLMQKRYIQGVISPKETVKFTDVTIKMQNKVAKVRDCYVLQPSLRDRLDLFLIDHKIRNYNTDEVKSKGSWSKKDTKSLFKELRNKGYGKLVDMIQWMLKESVGMNKYLKSRLGDVLRGCSRYILLSHIVPYPITNLLETYSVDNWSEIKRDIRYYQPAIFSVHEHFLKTNVEVPNCWLALVRELAQLSRNSVAEKEAIRAQSAPLPAAADKHQSIFQEFEVSGSCYGYQIHHIRPKYDYYSERKKKDNKKKTESDNNLQVANCNKYFHKFKSMSNGIVTCKCLEHEEMMGYHVMSKPEGLNDYFSLFIMIYKGDTAPKLVLCDIACQLEKYCMNREPKKFKNALFLNDEVHSKGHKCGPLYNVKYFKESLASLVFLNDPSIEQTNKICKNLKIPTMYMKLNTFMRNVCNLMEIESRKSIRKRQKNNR